jgi:hypothetical protein
MFNYMQTMSVMNFLKVVWPTEITETLKGIEFVGSAGHIGFGLDCFCDMGVKSVYLKLMATAALPVIIVVLSTLFWGSVSLVKWDWKYSRYYNTGTIFVLLFLVHSTLISASL